MTKIDFERLKERREQLEDELLADVFRFCDEVDAREIPPASDQE